MEPNTNTPAAASPRSSFDRHHPRTDRATIDPRMCTHPTSIVAPAARLGASVSVGPYAVIEQDTDIGEGSDIRAHAVIKRFTTLGPANTVHEGAVLGGEPQDAGFVDCISYL